MKCNCLYASENLSLLHVDASGQWHSVQAVKVVGVVYMDCAGVCSAEGGSSAALQALQCLFSVKGAHSGSTAI